MLNATLRRGLLADSEIEIYPEVAINSVFEQSIPKKKSLHMGYGRYAKITAKGP